MACDYLVAADGARSALRRALGVPLDGQPALQVASCLAFLVIKNAPCYIFRADPVSSPAQQLAMRFPLTEGGCEAYYSTRNRLEGSSADYLQKVCEGHSIDVRARSTC